MTRSLTTVFLSCAAVSQRRPKNKCLNIDMNTTLIVRRECKIIQQIQHSTTALKKPGMLILEKSLIKMVIEGLLQKQLDKISWYVLFGVQTDSP